MYTLSVPLTPELEQAVGRLVRRGYAETKAAVVRRAIKFAEEDEAFMAVLRSENDIREGRVLRGDLKTILKKFNASETFSF